MTRARRMPVPGGDVGQRQVARRRSRWSRHVLLDRAVPSAARDRKSGRREQGRGEGGPGASDTHRRPLSLRRHRRFDARLARPVRRIRSARLVAVVGERGDRGERAHPPVGAVPQSLAGRQRAGDPDRQLVATRAPPRGRPPRPARRRTRPACGQRPLGRARPRRAERVHQVAPVARAAAMPPRLPSKTFSLSMSRSSMPGASKPRISATGCAVCRARSSGEDRTTRDVAVGQPFRCLQRHLLAEVGELEPGQPAVEHVVGVVYLTVTQQVHDRARHRPAARPRARRVAAARRRSAASASSSWLAPTNHASYADGGR